MKALLLLSLTLAAPAAAQAPDWAKAKAITITMTDHGYQPGRIILRRDTPYVLHISNRSDKGHNLTQKAFFKFARVAPSDRRWTADGQIVLKAYERATIRFRSPATRSGGTYQFSSTTIGDADSDYTGVFIMR
ncbi:hypothetical protein HL653_15850 [Sphingomonas sp. AP4-R1]|nr:hypothetical protein HL653_15850 [Sphingomonas sp. AP4-R1]